MNDPRRKRTVLKNPEKTGKGFTLLELLIAIAIFSLLATACYQLLGSVSQTKTATSAVWKDLYGIQKAYRIIQKDIEQMAARPVRIYSGEQQFAMMGPIKTQYGAVLLTFTRHGHQRLTGKTTSELLRVAYALEDNTLVRYTWTTLDTAIAEKPVRQILLDDTTDTNIQFMDQNNQWISSWPPVSEEQKKRLVILPRAVHLKFDQEAYGTLNWWFSGVKTPPKIIRNTDNNENMEDADDDDEDDEDEDDEGDDQ